MENSQSIKHELTQVKRPTAEPKKSNSNIFVYLLTRHPWLLLTGLFTTFLGTAALALYNLTHVGDVEQFDSEPIPAVVEAPIATTPEGSNPLPLWMVVAIALSCGSGCWVILRLVNSPTKRQKVQRKHVSASRGSWQPTRHQKVGSQTLNHQPVFAPVPPLKPMVSKQSINKPLVTILPKEQKYPLDNNKESLADLMDLRRHNSLSTFLR
ncbi:hypothetical protein Nos7524_0286 [Nostoc sp. PCC 7524]|uniref:hypothetical protein n=1 Tax=Nostoc sp. (strain ATCC 29411 / PCC 7524) TaxID=28072 RepID=UPI00029F3E1F|nr:hypothetical protein [Nostoc sp. PCC 7524]AFY46208.1 hypothetical protein Nos7524_0286 [Nostoc sp. PCC 7524]